MKLRLLLSMLLLLPLAYAEPLMFDPTPKDDGYAGRGTITFYINITSPDLDTNNARLFVISEDAYNNQEPWDNYTMFCSGNWRCSRSVSFSTACSDTLEFFYFTSNDSSGAGSLGSSSSPLRFRIDRTCSYLENCGNCPADCGFCPSGGGSPMKTTITNNAVLNGIRNKSGTDGVEKAVQNIIQYAGTETPVFVTMVAVLVLAGLVIVIWRKKRLPQRK